MTAQPDLALPPDVATTLDELTRAMRQSAGDNLVGVILYGGLARGRYVPGSSDVNIVVLLRDASAPALEKIAPPLHAAWRSMQVEPFIITPDEVPRLAVTFPTKLLDIQRRHVALFGEDPFDTVTVRREDVRRRIEQELANLALRLRRRYLTIHTDPVALAMAADDVAAPLAVNLRALLVDRGAVPEDFEGSLAIYERAADVFGLDRDALAALKRVHQARDGTALSREMFARILATVERAARLAAGPGG